jgi:hypothetical protein
VRRERGSFATFTRLLEAYAHNRNSFQKLGFMDNLAQSSLKATVKSVARWTWDRYTGSGRCHRGVMQLDKDFAADRAAAPLAAARTRRAPQATESKVRAACRLLQQKGRSPHASRHRPAWRASQGRRWPPTSMCSKKRLVARRRGAILGALRARPRMLNMVHIR